MIVVPFMYLPQKVKESKSVEEENDLYYVVLTCMGTSDLYYIISVL